MNSVFRGLRLRIGRHDPPFFGVRKNEERKSGFSSPVTCVTAPFCKRAVISTSKACRWSGSLGMGVLFPQTPRGGGEVNSMRYPSAMIFSTQGSGLISAHCLTKCFSLPPTPEDCGVGWAPLGAGPKRRLGGRLATAVTSCLWSVILFPAPGPGLIGRFIFI